jgi:hypothetical protein
MRHLVEVRMAFSQPVATLWEVVRDPSGWPSMPGASITFDSTNEPSTHTVSYRLIAGLPVRDHEGRLALQPRATGGTEAVITEQFRPRIWGTGGYLRARRERAVLDLLAWCERVAS